MSCACWIYFRCVCRAVCAVCSCCSVWHHSDAAPGVPAGYRRPPTGGRRPGTGDSARYDLDHKADSTFLQPPRPDTADMGMSLTAETQFLLPDGRVGTLRTAAATALRGGDVGSAVAGASAVPGAERYQQPQSFVDERRRSEPELSAVCVFIVLALRSMLYFVWLTV